jgi:uncharacterized DUF497 family protein
MSADFEWDPGKAQENIRRHAVSFEGASSTFEDPFAFTIDECRTFYRRKTILYGWCVISVSYLGCSTR